MESLTLIDYILLTIIAVSVLIGLWRGFLSEFIALASWVAAFVVAFLFAEAASLRLVPYIDIPSVRAVLAFGGLFLATLILGALVNLVVAQLVKRTGLSGTDRLIGLVFGAARGAALVAVLILLATLTPLPQDPWWRESSLIPYFEPLALWLRDLLPPELAEPFLPSAEPVPAPVEPSAAPSEPTAPTATGTAG
ncbi:MAG: CvpA family protein [Candidatus Competibacterales bacterium]|nr:CvpA family protein [Candidatus Competibacterales bacterium]